MSGLELEATIRAEAMLERSLRQVRDMMGRRYILDMDLNGCVSLNLLIFGA